MKTSIRLSIALAALLVCGCATARRGEPAAPDVVPPSDSAARGEKVFAAFCHECHPGGTAGIGPALNNKPLPRFMIKFQVRAGMGAMPSFPKERIGENDLDSLAEYLVQLRRSK